MIRIIALTLLASLSCAAQPDGAASREANERFSFADGDRVLLLGSTVFEREQRYGTFEPRLALALPGAKFTLRNLAWSGDTVHGHARSYFGPPQEGLDRLSAHLDLIKPTVAILCYGGEFAFEGLGALPEFITGYRNLLERLRRHCPGVRIALVSPPPLETLPSPLPDQTEANKRLASFRDALGQFAKGQNCFFVDLFARMGGVPPAGIAKNPLTENGLHHTRAGYEALSACLVEGLGLEVPQVPAAQLAALNQAVVAKDQLFFNRWRPQNETYLFGFRKHEQGQNAKEIPLFDPLIQQADQRIQAAKEAALGRRNNL
jgi:lysophospholipase L1-like esterase